MGYAAELVSSGKFQVREIPTTAPTPGEVQVSVSACGVCGSDIQRFRGKSRQRYPMVLGHEISGTVSAVGAGVSEVREGDPIAVIPLIPCFKCAYCLQGDFGLCTQYGFVGSRQAGGFASTVTVPARNLVRLPDAIDLRSGVLVEPLAVGSHALERVRPARTDSLAILGGGSIGLCAGAMARSWGVEQVSVWDVSADRIAHAEKLGLSVGLVVPGEQHHPVADLVIEAAGSPAALRSALDLARPNGRIACVGTMQGDVHLPVETWEKVLRKQLTLVGVWNSYSAPFPGRAWSGAVSALAKDPARMAQIVTHRFRLEEVQACFEWALEHPGQYGKIVLCP
jgi:L-iditol 2-dehydrogenase